MPKFEVHYIAGGFGQVCAKFEDLSEAEQFSTLWIRGHSDQNWVISEDTDVDLRGTDQSQILSVRKKWLIPNSKNLFTDDGEESLFICECL